MASAKWETTLRRGGYRITPQRQLVLESVERLGHGTPEEILTEVQRTATGVNLSTVYRNLEVLEQVGLVTHAHIGHGAPTYHSVGEQVHIHLVCDRCGCIESVDASVADPFLDELRTRSGFVTEVSHVALHGICRDCSTASL
jgi:Fur family ferric uptake transcriptional regulator